MTTSRPKVKLRFDDDFTATLGGSLSAAAGLMDSLARGDFSDEWDANEAKEIAIVLRKVALCLEFRVAAMKETP